VSRLTSRFSSLSKQHRSALIPFITAGDPNPQFTVPLMHAMVSAGVDIIELGIPFSDPMADGPVIQRASERALKFDLSLKDVLGMVAEFRREDVDTPIVLMGYLNPIECMGYTQFVRDASDVGVDGVLIVDMPPEESNALVPLLNNSKIDPIFLLAPNSDEDRIKKISAVAGGYLYYVSLKGVTGATNLAVTSVEKKLEEIRQLTNLPLAVGFGVKNAETAAALGNFADAVVVGSALVAQVEFNLEQPEMIKGKIIEILKSMRSAMDTLNSDTR